MASSNTSSSGWPPGSNNSATRNRPANGASAPKACVAAWDFGPLIRITAIADRPGGVASAKIVSLRAGMNGFLSLLGCYRLIAAGNAHQGC